MVSLGEFLMSVRAYSYDGHPFGKAGVLHGIGTQSDTQPWVNPADLPGGRAIPQNLDVLDGECTELKCCPQMA